MPTTFLETQLSQNDEETSEEELTRYERVIQAGKLLPVNDMVINDQIRAWYPESLADVTQKKVGGQWYNVLYYGIEL